MTATQEKRPRSASANGAAQAANPAGNRKPPAKKAPRAAGSAGASGEAKRRAAAILEVLGGLRLPGDAAAALGVSLPRYYLLEQQALGGLLAACEPRAKGRVATAESRVGCLEKELARLRQECGRHQALVRAAQRTVGLSPPAAPKPPEKGKAGAGKKSRRRRPTVRALRAAQALRSDDLGREAPRADSSGPDGPPAVKQGPQNGPGPQAAGVPGSVPANGAPCAAPT